jgi:hypothetical protein
MVRRAARRPSSRGRFFDKMTVQREFLPKLTYKLAQDIGVQPREKLMEPGSLNREAEILPLVIDLRQ